MYQQAYQKIRFKTLHESISIYYNVFFCPCSDFFFLISQLAIVPLFNHLIIVRKYITRDISLVPKSTLLNNRVYIMHIYIYIHMIHIYI